MYWSKDFHVNSVADIVGCGNFQVLIFGKPITVSQSCGFEAVVVIQLAETLPHGKNYVMYYDNWFHFLELEDKLKVR